MAAAIVASGTGAIGDLITFTGSGMANNHAYRVNVQLPAPYGASVDFTVTSDGSGAFATGIAGSIRGPYSAVVWDGVTSVATSAAFNVGASTAPTITGSKGGNDALASLITSLAAIGLVVDGTT